MERIKFHTKFWSENLNRRIHSEDVGVDVRMIILECNLGKGGLDVRIGFIWHIRTQWRVLVNTVINLQVP